MFILLLFLCFWGGKEDGFEGVGVEIFFLQIDPFGYQAYEDYYELMRTLLPLEKSEAVAGLKWLSETISERMGAMVQRDYSTDIHRDTACRHAPVR